MHQNQPHKPERRTRPQQKKVVRRGKTPDYPPQRRNPESVFSRGHTRLDCHRASARCSGSGRRATRTSWELFSSFFFCLQKTYVERRGEEEGGGLRCRFPTLRCTPRWRRCPGSPGTRCLFTVSPSTRTRTRVTASSSPSSLPSSPPFAVAVVDAGKRGGQGMERRGEEENRQISITGLRQMAQISTSISHDQRGAAFDCSRIAQQLATVCCDGSSRKGLHLRDFRLRFLSRGGSFGPVGFGLGGFGARGRRSVFHFSVCHGCGRLCDGIEGIGGSRNAVCSLLLRSI